MRRHLQILIFVVLGVGFCYFIFGKQDLSAIWNQLQTANYWWGVPILLATLANHFSRAMRWRLLMQPLDFQPVSWKVFRAIMVGYLVSFAIPRLGDVTRCAVLDKKRHFTPLLGTVVSERSIDILSLLVVGLLGLGLQFEVLEAFFLKEIAFPFQNHIEKHPLLTTQTFILGCMILLVSGAILFFLRKKRIKTVFIRWLKKVLLELLRGLTSIFYMKHRLYFLLHTVFIWFTYFLMTYLWFFALESTSQLSIQVGIAMLFVGSVGRSVPIQGGGMLAYHYLFSQALLLFGVDLDTGLALALMIHGFQSIFYLIGGTACFIWLGFDRAKP